MAVAKSRKTSTTRKPTSGRSTSRVSNVPKATSKAGPTIDQEIAPAKTTTATAPKAPEPVVVEEVAAVVNGPALAKKELIDQVVEKSGVKKRDAKPVVEAVLTVLGEAVAEGRELNLKPFGKMRVNRRQTRSNGTVFVCKLRQPNEQEKNVVQDEKTES